MRKLLGCGALILMLVGAVFFVRHWNRVTPWGAGTGNIGRRVVGQDASTGQKVKTTLQQIAENPLRFKGRRETITGRVRDATRIASNRNLYLLVEGDARVVVIDDKAPPRPYYPRRVTGVVQVIGPPVGGLNYAYVTDVRSGVKVRPPQWSEVARFFTSKYDRVRDAIDQRL